ncbi:hypothetical protein ACROYT_G025618 [Oculina patagonica]
MCVPPEESPRREWGDYGSRLDQTEEGLKVVLLLRMVGTMCGSGKCEYFTGLKRKRQERQVVFVRVGVEFGCPLLLTNNSDCSPSNEGRVYH